MYLVFRTTINPQATRNITQIDPHTTTNTEKTPKIYCKHLLKKNNFLKFQY